MRSPYFQPTFGQPSVFDPMETGLAIEDVWPSLHIGADRVEEMKRKVTQLDWAQTALQRWIHEAETILPESPLFAAEDSGGRSAMHTNEGHHLCFDPRRPDPMWDSQTREFVAPREAARKAWVILCHERTRRLMVSLGFLWRLTGDDRYAAWVWEGLRQSVRLYRATLSHDNTFDKGKFGVVYSGLYEAQSVLQMIQALELVGDAPDRSTEDRQAVIDDIFIPVGERLSAWMDRMIVHNMSCWSMAALAELGRFLGREDWLEKAFHSERCGLRMLLERGLPRNEGTGKPDGFWFEHSPFYGCFYVITSLVPLYRAAEDADLLTDDLRERFASLFDAPPHLVDSQLRLLSISDRVAPGTMRIAQMRHIYEYAAGQIDERHAPLLALLYERCGATRVSLPAVAFGPDELPEPAAPVALTQSCVLPEAQLVTFRADTPRGAATLWFGNLTRYPGSAQGHHHMDKLSLSLHAFGTVITSDLGWPGLEPDPSRQNFLSGTLSHNTLMLDEFDQGTVETQRLETHLHAPIPWARGSFRGNTPDKMFETFRSFHKARLQEGLYDDARISRTVWFDFPRVVLLDELDAESEKRFGFIFHTRGAMGARNTPAEGEPLGLPPLPDEGAWRHFTGRAFADPVARFVADWRVRADIYLRLSTTSDVFFDAHWGATPGNPAEIRRGTIFLRAPGTQRRFATVLELHEGTPKVADVALTPDGVTVWTFDGDKTSYALCS